jgi:hypothetical protein
MLMARKKPTAPLNPPAAARRWAAGALLVVLAAAGCGADALSIASGADGNTTTAGGNGNTIASTGGNGILITNDKLAVQGLTALPLYGCVASDYYGTINVGGSDFQLLIDSGSSTTAVAADTCSACSALSPLYDLAGSTQQLTATTQYGDNSSWQGTIYTDAVAANANGVALTPTVNVSFAAITQESNFFTSSLCPGPNTATNGYQGILGLGPDTLLEAHTTSWMDAVSQNAGKLANDAYAVQLCDTGGRMWFGGYDPTFVAGDAHYTPMVQTGSVGQYYGAKVADMQFAGTSLGLSSSTLGSMVVDTGTSAFILPVSVFTKYATALSANANFKANFPSTSSSNSILYTGQCVQSAKGLSPDELDAVLPTVGISFPSVDGKSTFTLTLKASESYLFAAELGGGQYAYCSVMTYTSGLPIFGGAMMREHVVVFDRANEQIGFVPQAPCNAPLPTL